ncbi:MAG: ABC transporter substrate-binding protein [Reyranellaceae bacterium]
MRRRALIRGAAGLGLAGVATGATAEAMPRVGYLTAGDIEPSWSLFRKAMADLGRIDGRSVAYEFRTADPASGRLEALAQELVRLKVDVLVAVLSPAITAAKKATTTIPIVFNGAAPDTGTVQAVARPVDNLTGVFSPSTAVAAKCLQLFHEILPRARTLGLLLHKPDPFHVPLQAALEGMARSDGMAVDSAVIEAAQVPATLAEFARRRVDGVLVQPSIGLQRSAELALQHRLPAVSFRREFAEFGGLLAYGPDQRAMNRVIAEDVARLLKGARVADLPIQQASKFELVVNQKTARALGLPLPPLFVAAADEVLE